MNPTSVSLFSGVGGLDLALERLWCATPVVFAESAPYRRALLAKHWPAVPVLDDVAKVGRQFAGASIVAGGFPCQDISTMGPKTGMSGDRSGGGWAEFARVIKEVDPDVVAIENVAVLRKRGLDRVLADLADLGRDAAWTTVPVGGPIRRRRLFLLAVPNRGGREGKSPAWLHDHRPPGHDANRRDAAMVRRRAERGSGDGPEPGLHRSTLGPARGMDAARRRERLRCTGNAVAPAQAVLALRWCAEQLRHARHSPERPRP